MKDFTDIDNFKHDDECNGNHTTCETCGRMVICCNSFGAAEKCKDCEPFEVSQGIGDEARPVVWLYQGTVETNGDSFRFWYEYDERDGEKKLEFVDEEPNEFDLFDFQQFEIYCQLQVEKEMNK